MEPVYDIFSSVRTNLDQNRESLFVRLKASEIINRTLDLQVIMDDLLRLLVKEFRLDVALVFEKKYDGTSSIVSFQGAISSGNRAGSLVSGKCTFFGSGLP